MSQHSDLVHGQLSEVSERVAQDALNHRFALAKASDFASDVDVLNYALTLEYLESTFYEQGNARGLLSGQAAQYLQQVQKDEEAHVTAITQTIQKLGGTPVVKPMVNFESAFASKDKYLTTSFTFENTGVGAYLGAAGYVKNKDVLQAAAGIFGVECRHAAIVANLLGKPGEDGVYMSAFETPKSKSTVLNAVAPFLAMPGGGTGTGGGSTADTPSTGLIAGGGAAVLAGGAVAAYALRRRDHDAQPDGPDQG